VGETALTRRAREAFLDRADQARAPSQTISSGSGRPRRRRSWKNSRGSSPSPPCCPVPSAAAPYAPRG
jgi:hypothetical protein